MDYHTPDDLITIVVVVDWSRNPIRAMLRERIGDLPRWEVQATQCQKRL